MDVVGQEEGKGMHEALHRVDYKYSELHIAFTEKPSSIFEGSIFKGALNPRRGTEANATATA